MRIALGGRRLRGWVIALDVEPPADVELRSVTKVSGIGPPPEVFELAEWASWRWYGRSPTFLRAASPPRTVAALPDRPARGDPPIVADRFVSDAFAADLTVVRVPPGQDDLPFAVAAARCGEPLILCPSVDRAKSLRARAARAGVALALLPRDWAAARSGQGCVGSRAAAWAPLARPDAVLVIDEHDEAYQEESAPTWHARDVVVERARRLGVPCVLTSPAPSLDILDWVPERKVSRAAERAGWPVVDVIDRRNDDPAAGEWCSPRLVDVLRSDARVLCVLNRRGRARLLACRACGELARCERCDAAVAQDDDGFVCPRCGLVRPVVCAACGATAFRRLRVGVKGVRDELERLTRRSVVEITADTPVEVESGDLVVGTEAVLHRVERADVVAFLDFDQELLAPRYRAAEDAFGLLVRAARLLGPRSAGGRIVVQTRAPHHPVVAAALHADPGRLATIERARRTELAMPPETAIAAVSGPIASEFIPTVRGVEVLGPDDGRWLLRANDHRTLLDALAAADRPPGRLRVAVDPRRI